MLKPAGVYNPSHMLRLGCLYGDTVSFRKGNLLEVLARDYVYEKNGFLKDNQTKLFLESFYLEIYVNMEARNVGK